MQVNRSPIVTRSRSRNEQKEKKQKKQRPVQLPVPTKQQRKSIKDIKKDILDIRALQGTIQQELITDLRKDSIRHTRNIEDLQRFERSITEARKGIDRIYNLQEDQLNTVGDLEDTVIQNANNIQAILDTQAQSRVRINAQMVETQRIQERIQEQLDEIKNRQAEMRYTLIVLRANQESSERQQTITNESVSRQLTRLYGILRR